LLLVSTAAAIESFESARPIKIACEGADGILFELPDALTQDLEERLRRLGIVQAKSIEVWPSGLAAVVWDGEGRGEWFASERPCLAVRSDHAIGALLVSTRSDPRLSLEVAAVPPGEPIFIEFPHLAIGLHKVNFSALTGRGAKTEPIGDLDVFVRVREVRPWSPGVSPQGPLSVDVEPNVPTLEQFWENQVDIMVRGPAGRRIECRVSMFERTDDCPALVRQLPPVNLPLTSQQWREHFDTNVRKLPEVQLAYDSARFCEIEFSAGELGVFTVRCEREFTPLRWTIRRLKDKYVVRLYEDVGSDGELLAGRVPFDLPAKLERLKVREEYARPAAGLYFVPEEGGLYFARLDGFSSAIIVPPLRLEDIRPISHGARVVVPPAPGQQLQLVGHLVSGPMPSPMNDDPFAPLFG
jgi:hypothetical protein